MDGTLGPGCVVELAYPRVAQITGGGNERGVWQDKLGIFYGLQYSKRVLGQPDALEYLPSVGLCPVVDEVEERVHLGEFLLGGPATPLEGDSASFALIRTVFTCSIGQEALAPAAPGTAAVTLVVALVDWNRSEGEEGCQSGGNTHLDLLETAGLTGC